MTGLSVSWKIFRVLCILQLLMVATRMMMSLSRLFLGHQVLLHLIEIIVYALVFIFLYQGLSILNYNYPDIPLSDRQKKRFNILFIVNFLLISFLFGEVVSEWRVLAPVIGFVSDEFKTLLSLSTFFLLTAIMFIFHLIFLAGMFKLRRAIYQRTTNSWYQQFDETSPDNRA